MPYAAALLDLYTSVMSRQAFDLDFMSPGLLATTPEEEKAEPQTVVTNEAIATPTAADLLIEPTGPQTR